MIFRTYNPKRDKKAVHEIWKEVGWIDGDDFKPMDTLIESTLTLVADANKRAECLVVGWDGVAGTSEFTLDTITVDVIPEPATIGLIAIGSVGLLLGRRKFML